MGLISIMTQPLRLNATQISDCRIIISFSHRASAQSYYDYLKDKENSSEIVKFEAAVSGNQVSMNLPTDITLECPDGSKDVILAFEDEDKAEASAREMIVWEKRTNQNGNRRSISRSLTIRSLSEKLGLQVPEGVYFNARDPGTQFNYRGGWSTFNFGGD